MYKKSAQLTMVFSMMLSFIFGGTVQAGEIIYSESTPLEVKALLYIGLYGFTNP